MGRSRNSPRGSLARRALPVVAAILSLASALAVTSSCNDKRSAIGPGGECFLASDCEPGLVCIEQPNKSRVCSNDLTRVAGNPPMQNGGDGAPPADGDAPMPDGGPDTGQVDSGTDTGVDTGIADAGADG